MRIVVLLLCIGCTMVVPSDPNQLTDMPTRAQCTVAGYAIGTLDNGGIWEPETTKTAIKTWKLCLIKYPSYWVNENDLNRWNNPVPGGV